MKTKIRDTSAQDISRQPRPGGRRYIKWGSIAAVLAVIVVLALSAMANWFSAEATVSADRVRTATVERGSFVRDVGVQGRIVAAVSPTLYSPAGGTVTLRVQPGDAVSRDQVLADMDSPEIQAEYSQQFALVQSLQAELERQKIQARKAQVRSQQTIDLAKVKLTAAEREMRRAEKSIEIDAISDIDYERYKDELATAQVEHNHAIQDAALEKDSLEFEIKTRRLELESQQLAVENLKRRVNDLTIRSPVDGIVGNLAVNQKAVVGPNEPLITVVDLSAFEVEVRIPEAYADDLGIGMAAEVQYNSKIYASHLTALSPEVIANEVTGRLRFSEDVPQGLRQNQRLSARIVIDQFEDVLKIRRGAFTDTAGGRFAFVLDDQGMARKRPIRLGARSVSEVEIVSGLQHGDRVIISNVADFQGRDLIRVVQ